MTSTVAGVVARGVGRPGRGAHEPGRELGADAVGQRPCRAAARASARRAWRTASLTWTMRPRRSDTATRCAIESNVFSSSRRDRSTSSSSCMFSMALGELPAELVGAVEQVELAAGLDAHPLEDDRAERAARAAQRHRHGGRAPPSRTPACISARARRMAAAAGDGIVGGDARAARRVLRDPTRPAARGGAPAGRGSRPRCGRRRTGGSRRGRRCRGRRPG